jgi:hypothetical protein
VQPSLLFPKNLPARYNPAMTHEQATSDIGQSTSHPGSGLGAWCAMLLIVLAVYLGAYFATLGQEIKEGATVNFDNIYVCYDPKFSSNEEINDAMKGLFKPLVAIDQKLRPEYWDFKDD